MACRKCGCKDIYVRWEPGIHWSSVARMCTRQQEHLHRYCRNCGWDWTEPPLDVEPRPLADMTH